MRLARDRGFTRRPGVLGVVAAPPQSGTALACRQEKRVHTKPRRSRRTHACGEAVSGSRPPGTPRLRIARNGAARGDLLVIFGASCEPDRTHTLRHGSPLCAWILGSLEWAAGFRIVPPEFRLGIGVPGIECAVLEILDPGSSRNLRVGSQSKAASRQIPDARLAKADCRRPTASAFHSG